MTDFGQFAQGYGLIIDGLQEGRWVRVKTTDHPRKRNGAYKYLGDVGFVQNHATMDEVAVWHPDGKVEKIDPREIQRRMRESRKLEAERHARAAAEAGRIVKAATLVTPSPGAPATRWRAYQEPVLAHPYLIRKGLPEAPALVHEGFLIVPMRCDGDLVNVQKISPDGEKRFLPGGRAKGAVYRIGPARAQEVWICEGYATGLSLAKALKALYRQAAVVVCFSAGNLKFPGATHVMADNDASGAGAVAAEKTGLPWVMPKEVGMDANDLMVRDGLRALQDLVRSAPNR